MPMTPFMERFPELAVRETRSVTVTGRQDLPDGEYGFVELYCDEPGCDCRRVMIDVLRPETGWRKIWATINYGWESLDFYRKWGGGGSDPGEMQGPFPRPAQPPNQVLVRAPESVSFPSSVTGLRRPPQEALPNVPGRRGEAT